MSFCIKIPVRFKFKRFNKTYSKIKFLVDHQYKTNTIKHSPQFVCGIKALENGRFTDKLLNRVVLTLRRCVGKGRASWPRIRLSMNLRLPVTRKSTGHRMGSGKGAVRHWGVCVRSGTFIFKIQRSPIKYASFNSFDWTTLFAFFEYLDTVSIVYDRKFYLFDMYELLIPKNTLSIFRKSFILHKQTFKENRNFFYFFYNLCCFNIFKYKNIKYQNKFFSKIIKKYIINFPTKNIKKKTLITMVILFAFYFSSTLKRKREKHLKNLKYVLNSSSLKIKSRYTLRHLLNSKSFEYSFFDSFLHAEKSQRYSQSKLSYLVSLFIGLSRVKKKLPFRSEVLFFSQYDDGHSAYKAICVKRNKLKHLSQQN